MQEPRTTTILGLAAMFYAGLMTVLVTMGGHWLAVAGIVSCLGLLCCWWEWRAWKARQLTEEASLLVAVRRAIAACEPVEGKGDSDDASVAAEAVRALCERFPEEPALTPLRRSVSYPKLGSASMVLGPRPFITEVMSELRRLEIDVGAGGPRPG